MYIPVSSIDEEANRDKGHMDKVAFHFIDDSTFTSQWTWYANGTEDWMEEIVHTRIHDVPK